jgi:fatty acid-binding protein DegV
MSICILTDNTALFPPSNISGRKYIRTLTLNQVDRHILPPTAEDYARAFHDLEHEFRDILVLTISECILAGTESARIAAKSHGGVARIAVLDSRQSGPGVGLLAQVGARAATESATLADVEERVRAAIPHIYTLICPETELPAQPQAENGLLPVLSLEDGQPIPYKKVRTRRHLLESLQEFLEEFERPQYITYFRGHESSLRARPVRDAATNLFPGVPFTEMEMNPGLTALFGSQAIGLTIMELPK